MVRIRQLVSLVILGMGPAGLQAQWKIPWTYAGAAQWSTLDTAYAACAGRAQSPVDIRRAERADLPALRFEYRSDPLQYFVNNGHTVRVNYHDALADANALVIGNTRYRLTQFHFHHPGEELVDGKAADMVLHLMHEGSGGKVVGVAVLIRAGAANATVQKLWDHMPLTPGPEEAVPGVVVDPAGLLPRDLSYYVYEGSLTAPPCTEGVTWYVLKTPVELSDAQIAAFARLYPTNVRPVQPLNDRAIRESP